MARSRLKVIPDMKTVKVGSRSVLTPTGLYSVKIRKNGNILCLAGQEFIAEAIAELIENNLSEWNNIVDETRPRDPDDPNDPDDPKEQELNGRILDLELEEKK